MPANTKVCINGFVLSTLLFDCSNDSSDQEGFLFGSITRNVRDEINDLSLTGTQEDIHISICSSMPFGKFLSFYDEKGKVKKDEIEVNLQERKKNVIGWYRYRRYSPLYPSTRETAVHRNLKHFFTATKIGSQYFIFAVFSSSNLPNFATHSFDYAFFTQRQNSTFRNLATTILNLGDTRNSYRAGSIALPFLDSPSFNFVLTDTWNIENFYAIEDQIQNFHQNLRSKLESLQEELAASDSVNASLEEDIRIVSNEMQSLLVKQEQLSSSHSTAISYSTLNSQVTVSESSTSYAKCKDGVAFKRTAVDPDVPNAANKRACLDKYFETEDQNMAVSENIDLTSQVSSSTNSRLMIVDPDNGESSSISQNVDEINTQSANASVMIKDVNMVPSPSSTIEVVTESGSQNYTKAENSDLKNYSAPEPIINESSSKQVTCSNKGNASNLVLKMNVSAADTELQSQTISSDAADILMSPTTNLLSSSGFSSENINRKKTAPIIIYAAKEIGEHSKDSISSTCIEKCPKVIDQDANGETGDAGNLEQKEL